MRKYKTLIMTTVLCCVLMLMEGCSTSVLVDVWNDPSYHESPLKEILIIAIRQDPVQRRIWEDAFVAEFSSHGVRATSSYHLFPDDLPDTNQVFQSVHEKGFDGILITRLLQPETESHYVQGYTTTEQVTRYNIFRKRYDTYFRDVRHRGYVESNIIDRRAIDVWVIRNEERMIWGATSNSPERYSVEEIQNDIAKLVVPELERNGIIKSNK